ncbi:hypothetical protein GUJ93_ZPchr0006g42566 [Zizania palustris]|uniref:Translation initiation factor 3 C-terminal domain-containing protein n=1 Tax=Zizania palustris TaxID=103762 RepID=A0A8J5SI31_ZIZPA|nr:hypothetical protein GUJ93_ZPchr0006g42566 [Zizania palustris]
MPPRRGSWPGRGRRPDSDYDPVLDERIESSTVRLLDEQKIMVGEVSVTEAVRIADENDLILHTITTESLNRTKHNFVVCWQYYHLMEILRCSNYFKRKITSNVDNDVKVMIFLFFSAAKRMGLKELKMGYNIDIHDYSVRLKAASKFLKAGDKVKIMVNLKGRENLYKKQAIKLSRRFQNDVSELATEESKKFAERTIYVVLVPNKAAIQKQQDELNKKDTAIEVSDQSEDEQEESEAVLEQPEESKESEAEVSANV